MAKGDEESSGGVWQTMKDAVRDGLGGGDEESEENADESAEGEGGEGQKDEFEKAKEKVAALEDDPPEDLSEWPDDQAKYETFGGSDSEAYDDGATVNLGPPSLRRYPDGSVEIAGEKVDNPEDYKGEPIKGGPTDPDVTESEVARPEEKYEEVEGSGDSDSDSGDSGETTGEGESGSGEAPGESDAESSSETRDEDGDAGSADSESDSGGSSASAESGGGDGGEPGSQSAGGDASEDGESAESGAESAEAKQS